MQLCKQAKRHWLENSARFKPAEMVAGLEGIRIHILQAYTMAFIFATNGAAQKMCNDGGISARKTERGTHALTVCLRSPAELGWQQNAGGPFRQNVATLMGMVASDVQAVVIMGIPTRAIAEAGHMGEATFTIEERTEKLKLLAPSSGGGAMYSGAHIAKVYELEPSTLVDKRKKLAQLCASADGGRGEELAALAHQIEELQTVEMPASAEALADRAGESSTASLLLEDTIKQAVAVERARADRAEARAEQEKAAAEELRCSAAAAIKHIEKGMCVLMERAAAAEARADRAEVQADEHTCTNICVHTRACACTNTQTVARRAS